MIIDILFFHCSFVDMLNIISTCWDSLCVDINVDKGCVDHSTNHYVGNYSKGLEKDVNQDEDLKQACQIQPIF